MSSPRLLAVMAAHLPRLPVLLFIFLALHVPASHGDPLPTTYDGSICLESSFSCGRVQIRYPFYLANSTKATSDYSGNYSCGYTDLEISCLGEGPSASPVIRLGGETYTVQDISYDSDNYKVTLVDRDVLVGGSCPAVRHGVTFDGMWLHNTSSNDDLTFYFGCYSGGPRMPAGLHKYQIDCNFESPVPGGGVAFVLTPDDHDKAQEHDLAADCTEVVSVLVKTDALSMASNRTNFTSGGYGDVLKQGFELSWSRIATDQCPQCEQSGGKCSYSQNKRFQGCLCSDRKVGNPDCNSTAPAPARASRHGNKKTTIDIVASISSLLFLSLLILAFFLTCKYGSLPFKSKNKPRIESFLQKNGNLHPKRYSYADVKRMTKSFAVKLGQGGFGAVYKGNLSNGSQVAVKMLKDVKGDGEEFMNEVASISRTSHVNVVTLLGFCLEGSKRALIYEYMPNGSLERYVFSSNLNSENTLSWEKLFDIAIGIARGLEYLHRGCNTRIVHFDIKPQNILLDHDFRPKISDFGLAKLCLNKESVISTPPLLSPSPCSLLRFLRLCHAPRRRNPTAAPPTPYTFRRRPLLLLPVAMSSSASITAPNSVVADPSALARKVAAIRAAGPSKLQVIADFDGTLTRYWYDGARGQSSHGLLRQGNEEYDAKREALYEHYHPIEICPDIPLPEKAKLMEEWWEKTHGLLIEGGLTYEAIKKSVSDAAIAFRDGVVELFEYLEERDIPVLVFSAGLADIIEEVFRQKLHRSFKNIKVVSNRMVFNEEGRLVAFKGKTIHVLNKNEHALDMAAPVHDSLGDPNGSIDDYSLVKKRTNVLLLGDHIGDLGMSDGLNYENRIAVGFLNANIEKSLKDYSKAFDIVYLNDAPMRGVVELVSELCP